MDLSPTVVLGLGVALGACAAAGVAYIALATRRPTPATVLTTAWRLGQLEDPVLVVRDLGPVDVPSGARILASGIVDHSILARCVVRQVPSVPAEYAVAAGRTRAVLFLAGAQPDTLAAQTVDPHLIERLDRDARMLWERASPYVEHHPIASLAGRAGIPVETTGRARDAVAYGARYLLSLEDSGAVIGVLLDKDPAVLAGERLQVRGTLVKDAHGYSAIEATDVRRVR